MPAPTKLPPRLSPDDIESLLERIDAESSAAREELERARPIAEAAGLIVYNSILDPTYAGAGVGVGVSSSYSSAATAGDTAAEPAAKPMMDFRQEAALAMQARKKYNPLRGTLSAFPLVLSTTAGYSNTDHIVHQNPDGTVDKLSEYKRRMKRRACQTQLEERGADRWDMPRIPGGRRRRIKRDVDRPAAPPEPPPSGYIVYVSQMTTKLRSDNPERHHNQITAVRRISSMWKKMSQKEREHYVQLAKDARAEYEERLAEHRVTGNWAPFTCIARLGNKNGVDGSKFSERNTRTAAGPWVRKPPSRQNPLERELESYEQVLFPPRPAALDEYHEMKVKESLEKRKKKIREEGIKYS